MLDRNPSSSARRNRCPGSSRSRRRTRRWSGSSFTSRNTTRSVAPSERHCIAIAADVDQFRGPVPFTASLPSTTGNKPMTSARSRYSVLPLPAAGPPPFAQHGDVPLTTVVTGARSVFLNCVPVRPAVGLSLVATAAQ